MYIVEWCDQEGNLQQRRFGRLHDAKLEAAGLLEEFGWAEIVDKFGFRW